MQHKLHSCMPSSEADPAPQHLSQFIPRQFFNLLPCSTNYTAVCHLQRQIPFLSICHSSCHINFLSLAVQHKLHIQLYATFRGRPHSSASVTVHATSTFYLLLCSTNYTYSCMPPSEADPIPQHLSQFMPHQLFISCCAAQTTHTAVCHLQRQTPFLSICHSSCHINFLSLAVQHKLHSYMPSSEADLDVTLTGHPLHPPRCSCLHRMWWEVAAPSSANLGHTVSKRRPAAQYTNTSHKHQVVGHLTQTPGGQSRHTNTRWLVTSHKHQVVSCVTQTLGGWSRHTNTR